jgi:hypothetical protein
MDTWDHNVEIPPFCQNIPIRMDPEPHRSSNQEDCLIFNDQITEMTKGEPLILIFDDLEPVKDKNGIIQEPNYSRMYSEDYTYPTHPLRMEIMEATNKATSICLAGRMRALVQDIIPEPIRTKLPQSLLNIKKKSKKIEFASQKQASKRNFKSPKNHR